MRFPFTAAQWLRFGRQLALVAVLAGVCTRLAGAEAPRSPGHAVSFRREVAPILAQKCVVCHGPEKIKGGYQLHHYEAMLKPGRSKEPALTAGHPEASLLFKLITATDPDDRMPQKDDPLPRAQIELIERWIREGAKFDGMDPKQTFASMVASSNQPDPPEIYSRPVPVLALAFDRAGNELAAGGYHEITVWSGHDGRLLRRIKNLAQQITGLAFSPDGSILAAAAGTPGKQGEVKLFDPASGRLRHTLTTSGDVLLAVAFSPDGRRLAAAGSDNAIRLFDVTTGKEELVIEQHADWVLGLAFSPDGSRLASASRDKTARLFDAKSGELDQTYTGHGGPVFAVAFTDDGKRVVSASRDREIHVWDVAEAKKLSEVTGFGGDVLRIAVRSNLVFSATTDRLVRQHSLEGKKAALIREFVGHNDVIYALAFHPETHRLASGAFDGEVRVWDTTDGALAFRFVAAPGYPGPTRAWAPDQSRPGSVSP